MHELKLQYKTESARKEAIEKTALMGIKVLNEHPVLGLPIIYDVDAQGKFTNPEFPLSLAVTDEQLVAFGKNGAF